MGSLAVTGIVFVEINVCKKSFPLKMSASTSRALGPRTGKHRRGKSL